MIAHAADMFHAAVLPEGVAIDAVTCHVPQPALRVAIDLDSLLLQQMADVDIAVGRHRTVHGSHVNEHHALVVSHPKPLVTVFGKALARVTDGSVLSQQVGPHVRIAVVAHRTAAIAADPHKALAIYEDVVDIVVWKS